MLLMPGLTPRPTWSRVSSAHLGVLYALAAIVVSIQKYNDGGYNNYLVFTQSLRVLLAHQNLYAPHTEYYGDLFKYSPTFPLVMAPLTWLPTLVGLILWNLLNAVALYGAIVTLWPGQRRAVIALALIVIEFVISLQHTQSNALVAALIVLAYAELEAARSWRAAFYIVAGFFLKGYGAAVGSLALLFRTRFRTIAASSVSFVVLALLPLVVLSPGELVEQYRHWFSVGGTFTVMRNTSIMRVIVQHVHSGVNPALIQLAGLVVFLLPFVRVHAWPDPRFRLRVLCSLLIALVIFNNSAEPPTYVIAMTGAAIWYASEPREPLDRWLMLALLVAIMLVSTDVYPRALRGAVAGPWAVKTVGSLIVWLRISWELMRGIYEKGLLKPAPTSISAG
jgi:hypothetical protein